MSKWLLKILKLLHINNDQEDDNQEDEEEDTQYVKSIEVHSNKD